MKPLMHETQGHFDMLYCLLTITVQALKAKY
jgi:hypothetical protein